MRLTKVPYVLRGTEGQLIDYLHVEGERAGKRYICDMPLDEAKTPQDVLVRLKKCSPIKPRPDDTRPDLVSAVDKAKLGI